jgi:hypothetical protein
MGVRALNVLGVPITLADGRLAIRAKAHAALTAGKLYSVVPSRDTTTDITTSAAKNDGSAVTQVPATLAVQVYHGIPERDYAIGDVALLIIGGPVKAFAINTAGAITGGTSYLKAVNTSSNLQVDGAARTTSSVAFACEDQNSATASLINVQMIGIPSVI